MSSPTPADSLVRPSFAPAATVLRMPLPLTVALAAWAVADRPCVAFGWTAATSRRATGSPSPLEVKETSCVGEPIGPNSTSDHTSSVLPSASWVIRAPGADTPVRLAGNITDSWPTRGSATSCSTVAGWPSAPV